MALFSDLDWMIVLGAAALLLLGEGGASTVRQLGRWYGRALRLKQELVGELARAADLPMPADGGGSLRAALLGLDLDAPTRARLSVPLATPSPPTAPPAPTPPSPLPCTGGYPVASWSATYFGGGPGEVR